jgi:hypothetical protein
MFTDNDDNIVDRPKMLVCAIHTSDADGTHVFLKCEGCMPCSNGFTEESNHNFFDMLPLIA